MLKYHCVAVIVSVWFCALVLDSRRGGGGHGVPYFPIEISRTASSGPYAQRAFQWGTLSLLASVVMYCMKTSTASLLFSPLPVWVGAMIAAWFPDNTHVYVHCTGVIVIMLSVTARVFLSGDQKGSPQVAVFLCAAGLECARLAMKGFIVLFAELDDQLYDIFHWRPYVHALFNVGGLRDRIVRRILEIMFANNKSEAAGGIFIHVTASPQTLSVLRVSGAMQWAALYLMSTLY